MAKSEQRTADSKQRTEVRRIRLADGQKGGFVNRLGRRVAPGEVVKAPAETADWLIEQGVFVAE